MGPTRKNVLTDNELGEGKVGKAGGRKGRRDSTIMKWLLQCSGVRPTYLTKPQIVPTVKRTAKAAPLTNPGPHP